MIPKEKFVEELNQIIFAQEKREEIETKMSEYIKGFRFPIPDANEERAIRYLSGLIGLGIDNDSPLLDWYYSPFRHGVLNNGFVVRIEDEEPKTLATPEDFYDFYCGI